MNYTKQHTWLLLLLLYHDGVGGRRYHLLVSGHRQCHEFVSDPYPGEIPTGSFAIRGGYVEEVRHTDVGMVFDRGASVGEWLAHDGSRPTALDGSYVPMLAYGSNACPGRLVEKFGAQFHVEESELDRIVALAVTVAAVARAWTCRLTQHGILPVTLAPSVGRELDCHVLLLPRRLVPLMDASEGRGGRFYSVTRLTTTNVTLPGGGIWHAPITYLGKSSRAPLVVDGAVQFFDEVGSDAAQAAIAEGRGTCGERFLLPHEDIDDETPLIDIVDAQRRDQPVFELL
ncbi:MAG: hypothetical protein HQ526_07710 [Actinobacteria bacterium]|nr:hypothetical protein [Actinomycetota bacterium]